MFLNNQHKIHMKVLVIIVTYNGMKWLGKCLDSLRTSTVSLDVYIVDNGSTDGTQEFICDNYPEVTFVQSKSNIGFGKANNLGLRHALVKGYDYVYLLNQDAWIFPDTMETLIACHLRHPEYGILSPMQMEANTRHLDHNFNRICAASEDFIDDFYYGQYADVYSVDIIMAAHWLISRSCLSKVGGFSPTFPHYGEDNNYTNRCLYHHFKVGFVPKAKAVHDRENRSIPVSKIIYMNYIFGLISLSNIYNPQFLRGLRVLEAYLYTLVKYPSFKNIGNLLKTMLQYKRIVKNRRISMGEKAFL